MTAFVLRRLLIALVVLFGVVSLAFVALHLAPGDPLRVDDPDVPRERRAALRESFGLDRPLPAQYVSWLGAIFLHWDWGVSLASGREVTAVIRPHIGPTVVLAGAALAVQYGLGLLVGVWAARRAGGAADHLLRAGLLSLYSIPVFWLALLALMAFSLHWQLFPYGGWRSVGAERLPAMARLGDHLHHLVLPSLVLGLGTAAAVARFTRNSLLGALGQDHLQAARARGLSEGRVVWLHALRNALVPLIQIFGMSLPLLLSGALVVEKVFGWPGLGRLVFDAATARDYPVVLAATTLSGGLVVLGSLTADLLHAWADPRVRP